MSRRTTKLIKAALSAIHYAGADRLLAPLTGGAGAIFMLHHVTPEAPAAFEPNRILRITPEFLDRAIGEVLQAGYDVVALDEVPGRLARAGQGGRPFACFTFDDGYRDNRDHALPVFRKYNLPFAVYLPTDFADGEGDLWWLVLERAIAQADSIDVDVAGQRRRFATRTVAEKDAAYHVVYWSLRRRPEAEARAVVAELAASVGYDGSRLCSDLVMSWDELRAFARDPLVTIGAHTCGHWALAGLPEPEARRQMADSIARIERELGRPCRHFSYPYGSAECAGEREFAMARELGLATAVTTRKGLLRAGHAERLTALPRVSLNGDYQDVRYTRVMLSGAPFALYDAANSLRSRWAAPLSRPA